MILNKGILNKEISGKILALVCLALCVSLTSCGPYQPSQKQLANACLLLEKNSGWKSSVKKALKDKQWRKKKLKAWVLLSIIYHESHFKSNASPFALSYRNKLDSRKVPTAIGYAQAKLATWQDYQADTGRYAAQREIFADSVHFVAWYMAKSMDVLGLKADDVAAHYLAYHEGWTGYSKGSYKKSSKKRLREKASTELTRISDKIYKPQLLRCGFNSN